MVNFTMINPTNTSVYLNRMLGWQQINVRKIFPEVINVSYGQWQTIFTDFNLDQVTRDKKLLILPKLCSFLLLHHRTL